jgi:hypothetical protein
MDANFNWTFDANTIAPRQGGGAAHPVGNKFAFSITDVEVVPTKDNSGGMLVIEFTSDAGSVKNRYNLWNANDTARRIANEQLSALCHAVGIFQIGPRQGKELVGAKGMMDIGHQKLTQDQQRKRDAGEVVEPFVELKKVYNAAGIEPGQKAPAAAAAGFGTSQPTQATAPASAPTAAPETNAGGWNANGAAPGAAVPWGQ